MKLTLFTLNHPFRITVIAAVISVNAAFSQEKKIADRQTLDLIKAADDKAGKSAGALIILKDYETTINEKGESTLVLRILGKVYNSQALEAYSHIPLGYNSYYEEPSLEFARVIRNDGSIIEVRKDAIQIKTSPDFMGDTKYSDTRYLTFAFSGLEIGAAFEYKATFRQKRPVVEGQWFENHYFGGMLQNLAPPYIPRMDPVLKSVYRLKVPKNIPVKYQITCNPVDPVIKSSNYIDEYTWEYSGLPSREFESGMPPLSKLTPVLLITTVFDWSEIDRWAAAKLNAGSETSTAFKLKVNSIIQSAVLREDRIKAITAYIRDNIRYVYADLDRGGYQPHSITEILNSLYGDCKDQGMLLTAMLREAGIEAYPALVNPWPGDEFTDVPSPYFSHLITCIPGEKDTTWVDMTSKVCSYPELPASDQYRNALIVNGKGGALVKTPGSTLSGNMASFDVRCGFNKADVNISISISASGLQGEALKSAFMMSEKNDREESLKSFIRDYFESASFDSVDFSDLESAGNNFRADINYHIDTVLKNNQPAFSFAGHSAMPLVLLAGMDSRSMPEKRVNDLISPYPYTVRSSEVYNPPSHCPLIITLPEDQSMKNEFFEFSKKFSRKGSSVSVNWELRADRMTVPKEKYTTYVNEIKKLEEMAGWSVTFVDPVAFTRTLQSEDPRSVLKECDDILKKDKKNVFALLMKGYFFNRLNMKDSSMSNFNKVLRLDSENKYAHLWITLPLSALKKDPEVLAHFEKSLQADPLFDEAYLARGAWYMVQKQPEKGNADFRKAVEVDSSSVMGWLNLGLVSYNEKKYTECIDYMKKALTIDSSNSNVYRMLADAYLKTNNYNKAMDAYTSAIELSPGDAALYGNLGWTYYLLDDFNKCLEYSSKALSIDSNLYFVKFNIALTNLRTGKVEEAKKLYAGLKKEKNRISTPEIEGAMEDLRNLKAKGLYINESEKIIRLFQ